jgi:hypothetical protein
MKKQISLLVIVLTMALGLSPPTFAAPDFGTENHFTLEQATIDMDITIDVTMEVMPVMEFELSPEPIYLEGVVIMYPHLDEGYVLRLDQAALTHTGYKHKDMYSTGRIGNSEIIKEGPLRLELYSTCATWRFQETYF